MRLIAGFTGRRASDRCHEMASPSRSGSVAMYTEVAAFAASLSSLRMGAFPLTTMYRGVKPFSTSTPSRLRGRSFTWPIEATIAYLFARSFLSVRAFVGDSTTTRDIARALRVRVPLPDVRRVFRGALGGGRVVGVSVIGFEAAVSAAAATCGFFTCHILLAPRAGLSSHCPWRIVGIPQDFTPRSRPPDAHAAGEISIGSGARSHDAHHLKNSPSTLPQGVKQTDRTMPASQRPSRWRRVSAWGQNGHGNDR